MDSESRRLFHGYSQSEEHVHGSSFHHFQLPEVQCIVCRREYTPPVTEGMEVPGSISICRECKSLVVDDHEATPPIRNFRRRRLRRERASRHGSSESVEDLFSQQFSQLISLVRQSHDIQGDDADVTVTAIHRTSYSPARNWPRSLRRTLSDNEMESLDPGGSLFGETDSNISFNGGDSETSFDGQSLLGRDMFTQQDHESHFNTDTDIDPMHAGLDQWNSDDEDGVWEGINMEETAIQLVDNQRNNQDTFSSPSDSMYSAQNGRWIRWRVSHADRFADLEEPDVLSLIGNASDYLDARGFDELMEQLVENDDSRRGAPPAAASAIGSLPQVIISKDHEKSGSLVCAVCKDPLSVDTEAKQLPCLHLYHPSCIIPWLRTRNSCPVCRYELPTDDREYEEGKRVAVATEIQEIHQQDQTDNLSDVSSDVEVDDEAMLVQAEVGGGNCVTNSLNRESRSGRRWYVIAAAPIVSIVGIALALWFHDSKGERRGPCRIGEQGQPRQISQHRS